MSSQIFQSFWYGAPLSPYEWMCIKSFLDHGHAYHLYSYGEVAVPEGCVVMDAAEILPQDQIFSYKDRPGFSAFSNWFRYKLLHMRGNWWVDTDVVCLSRDWPGAPRQVGYEDNKGKINGAAMRADAGDTMMAEAFRISQDYGHDVTWGTLGPQMITKLIETGQYDYKVHETFRFYPVFHETFSQLLVPQFATLDELRHLGAVCLHLWNEMFRIYKIDKKAAPPPHSLLWQCFERAGLSGMFETQYLYNAEKKGLEGPVPIAAVTPELVQLMLDMVRQNP